MIRTVLLLASILSTSHYLEIYAVSPTQSDVVVYGSTPAGIMAAIQASQMGKSTLLVNTNKHVGGVMTSGLGATDMNSSRLIGGQARKFFQRVYRYYLDHSAWRAESRDEYFARIIRRVYTGKADQYEMQWVFEPHVALKLFNDMLSEAKVKVVNSERLDLPNGVVKENNVIKSIRMASGNVYTAKVFIDASYEGDLMAKAGVSYIVGRESNSQYGEQFNGVRGTRLDRLFAPVGGSIEVDPYLVEGNPKSGLLPLIEPAPRGANGDGDHGVQAYCYRFTLTSDPENLRPITQPKNYNPLWFEMYGRICQGNPQIELPKLLGLAPLPNKKTDVNAANIPGANYGWAEGDYELRAKLAQMHKSDTLWMNMANCA